MKSIAPLLTDESHSYGYVPGKYYVDLVSKYILLLFIDLTEGQFRRLIPPSCLHGKYGVITSRQLAQR